MRPWPPSSSATTCAMPGVVMMASTPPATTRRTGLGGVLEAGGDAALAGVIHRDDHGAAVGREDMVQATLGVGHGGARLPAGRGAVNRVRDLTP